MTLVLRYVTIIPTVTVIFYTAVHLVEQFLAHKGQDLLSRETRERFISQSADLKPI